MSEIQDFISRLWESFPAKASSFLVPGFKTGLLAAKSIYVDQVVQDVRLILSTALGVNNPVTLGLNGSLLAVSNILNYRGFWSVISPDFQYVVRQDGKVCAKESITHAFDTEKAEQAIIQNTAEVLRSWYKTFIEKNPLISGDKKKFIAEEIERVIGKPMTFESAVQIAEGKRVLPYPVVTPKIPENALGTYKQFDTKFVSDGGRYYVFKTTSGGEEQTLWLVPGRSVSVLSGAKNYEYGRDYWLENGVLVFKDPPPAGTELTLRCMSVESDFPKLVKEYSPFFSGASIGAPISAKDDALSFISTGISSQTWEYLTQELARSGINIRSMPTESLNVLVSAAKALQEVLDLVTITSYAEEKIGMPSWLESLRIPKLPVIGYKIFGITDRITSLVSSFFSLGSLSFKPFRALSPESKYGETAEKRLLWFNDVFKEALSELVEAIRKGETSVAARISDINKFTSYAISLIEAKRDWINYELTKNGFSASEIDVFRNICEVYASDRITSYVTQNIGIHVKYGMKLSEEQFVKDIERELDAALRNIISRCTWSKDGFRTHAEFLDSIVAKINPAWMYLDKPEIHKMQEAVNELWEETIRPNVEQLLSAALSGKNLQALRTPKEVLISVAKRMQQFWGDKISAIRWVEVASSLSIPGERSSPSAYVGDILKGADALIRTFMDVATTKTNKLSWIGSIGFWQSAEQWLETFAQFLEEEFVKPPRMVPGVISDWVAPIRMFVLRTLSSEKEISKEIELEDKLSIQGFLGTLQFNPTSLSAEEEALVNRCVAAIESIIHLDRQAYAYYKALMEPLPEPRYLNMYPTSTSVYELMADRALKLELALESNEIFRKRVIAEAKKPITPVSVSTKTDPLTIKWRAAVMGNIAGIPWSQTEPFLASEVVRDEIIFDFLSRGWSAIENWLGPVLSSNLGISQSEAIGFLKMFRDPIEGIIDSTIESVRLNRGVLLDPKGELYIKSPDDVRVSSGAKVFRSNWYIDEREVPTISALALKNILDFVRSVGKIFLSPSTGSTVLSPDGYLTEEELIDRIRLYAALGLENAKKLISPALPMAQKLNAQVQLKAIFDSGEEEQIRRAKVYLASNNTPEAIESYMKSVEAFFDELGRSATRQWTDVGQDAIKDIYGTKPESLQASLFLDSDMPSRFRFNLMTSDEIESEISSLLSKWKDKLMSSVVTGVPGQDYAVILNTQDWTQIFTPDVFPPLVGETEEMRLMRLSKVYEEAKAEFLKQEDELLRPLLRVLFYQTPLSSEQYEAARYSKYRDFDVLVPTGFRLLTNKWENFLKERVKQASQTLKFESEIDLSNVLVREEKFKELISALVDPKGSVREIQNLIIGSTTSGLPDAYQKGEAFFNEVMGELKRLFFERVPMAKMSTTDYLKLSYSILQSIDIFISRIQDKYIPSRKDGTDMMAFFAQNIRNEDIPIGVRVSWIKEAERNPESKEARTVLSAAYGADGSPGVLVAAGLALSPREINQQIYAFRQKFQRVSAGVISGDGPLVTEAIKELSWDYLERLYSMVVKTVEYPIERGFIRPTDELRDPRLAIISFDNIQWYELIKYMYENKLCYPTSPTQSKEIADGFRRAIQAASSDPSKAIFARIWDAVKPALSGPEFKLFEDGGLIGWGVRSIAWNFSLATISEMANDVNRSIYIDAWGRSYSFEEAKYIANFSWMWSLLRMASAGHPDSLTRFDTQFELIWKPFMYHEALMRSKRPESADYFTELGKLLMRAREGIVTGKQWYIHEGWGTLMPEDDPLDPKDYESGKFYGWLLYTVELSVDRRIYQIKVIVSSKNNNADYIIESAKDIMRANLEKQFTKFDYAKIVGSPTQLPALPPAVPKQPESILGSELLYQLITQPTPLEIIKKGPQ